MSFLSSLTSLIFGKPNEDIDDIDDIDVIDDMEDNVVIGPRTKNQIFYDEVLGAPPDVAKILIKNYKKSLREIAKEVKNATTDDSDLPEKKKRVLPPTPSKKLQVLPLTEEALNIVQPTKTTTVEKAPF